MDCQKFIMGIHYAQRWPSVTYAFGLFRSGELVGVVTYGRPPSNTLCEGVAGEAYSPSVIELNRLCLLGNLPNEASLLVGRSLRLLAREGNFIVVSFADPTQGHAGFVYQATNFSYHGLSAKRTDWKIRGMEHLHSFSIGDMVRGEEDRAAALRERFGDDFYSEDRPRKHRYIYLCGDKAFKRAARAALAYPEEPYPKTAGDRPERVQIDRKADPAQPTLFSMTGPSNG
jgi:hypothetical protein